MDKSPFSSPTTIPHPSLELTLVNNLVCVYISYICFNLYLIFIDFEFPENSFYPMSRSVLNQLTNFPRKTRITFCLKKVKSVVTVLELEVNYLTLKMFYVYCKLSLKSNGSILGKVNLPIYVPCENRAGREG